MNEVMNSKDEFATKATWNIFLVSVISASGLFLYFLLNLLGGIALHIAHLSNPSYVMAVHYASLSVTAIMVTTGAIFAFFEEFRCQ